MSYVYVIRLLGGKLGCKPGREAMFYIATDRSVTQDFKLALRYGSRAAAEQELYDLRCNDCVHARWKVVRRAADFGKRLHRATEFWAGFEVPHA